MDSFALCLPYWFPYGCLEIMKREPKFVITLIFRCNIFQILKSMRRGTTQEKTTKLLKISVQQFQKWLFVQL
jgi:hypothetical protein